MHDGSVLVTFFMFLIVTEFSFFFGGGVGEKKNTSLYYNEVLIFTIYLTFQLFSLENLIVDLLELDYFEMIF